jgi:hypothetical protein
MAQQPDPQTWQPQLPVRGRRWVLDRSGDQFVVWDTFNAKQPAWFPATEAGWLAAWKRHRTLERDRGLMPLFVVLTTFVGLWMLAWVILTLLVSLGPETPDSLGLVLLSELISVPAAILLMVFRRTRWWGLAIGFLGTGGVFLLFDALSPFDALSTL